MRGVRLRAALKRVRSQCARVHPDPVFVLGKEKSGTTAIAALLASCSGRTVTLDTPALWGDTEQAIYAGRVDFADFVKRNRLDFSREIVKEPCFTFLYPQIKACFPKARVVMVVRDPRDNTRSVLNRVGIAGNLADPPPEAMASLDHGWDVVLDGSWLGLEPGSYIETLARRWNLAADVYLEHRDEMMLFRYEDFMADKQGAIEQFAATLGWPVVHDISGEVDHAYQPAGDRNVTWADFFGPENLATIERLCARRMAALGYEVSLP